MGLELEGKQHEAGILSVLVIQQRPRPREPGVNPQRVLNVVGQIDARQMCTKVRETHKGMFVSDS